MGRMGLLVLSFTFLAGLSARAATTAIEDCAGTPVVLDGTIGAGEYGGASTGTNNGFAGMIGSGVRLHVDSDNAGLVAWGVDLTGTNCMWGADDTVVIYVDSEAGGFSSTAQFFDAADSGRRAVSGRGTGGESSVLTFSTGFEADYAIVMRNDFVGLFRLVAGGNGAHVFINQLTRAPADWSLACHREAGWIALADLGMTAGQSFRYVATLINSQNAYRSNEFQGVPDGFATGGNIGAANASLPAGSYNTFTSYAHAPSFATCPFSESFDTFDGAGFAPEPLPTQMDSDYWRVLGMSDAATMAFGETQTFGDFARGVGSDSAATGGVYRWSGLPDGALGILATNADFDPGVLELRLTNRGSLETASITVSYKVPYNNTQARSGTIGFEYSTDGANFTAVSELNVVTPLEADAFSWSSPQRSSEITVVVPAGGDLFLRWTHLSTGGGSRDKFAIDDVIVSARYPVCGDGAAEGNELCDDGPGNGATECGCTSACGFPVQGVPCGAPPSSTCDADDTCDGAGLCIARFAPADTVCRLAVSACDVTENCTGANADCPLDEVAGAAAVCNAATNGACDDVDVCDGTTTFCADAVKASDVTCRDSDGDCDVAETCTGSSPACPDDTFHDEGTSCADTTVCNGVETCSAVGTCRAGTTLTCDDQNLCTADSCDPTDGCAHDAIADCCNVSSECDDSDVCTTDACSGPGGTCSHNAISECCIADEDCADSSACTADTCNTTENRCVHAPITGCCVSDGDCDDGNVCTTQTCAAGSTCDVGDIAGCCRSDGDCDDSDTCTTDTCGTDNRCTSAPIDGCCAEDADCEDADACTADSCSTATSTCTHSPVAACGDAGVADASLPEDAGGPADASEPIDAGDVDSGPTDAGGHRIGRDASAQADAGSSDDDEPVGCSCRAGGNDAEEWLGLMGLLGFALVRARRRP